MCEINSKGPDPPRSPQGYSLPKRTQGGVQPLDFISFILIPISGQARWFYLWKVGLLNFICVLLEAWYLSYFQMSAPFNFGSNLHLWLDRKKQQPWLMKLMKSPAKLASNCKVHEVYFVEHCCHAYQTHRYTFPHLQTLLFFNFQAKICQDIEFDPNKKAAKSCTSSVPG